MNSDETIDLVNSKLALIGKKPMYHRFMGEVFLDVAQITKKNFEIPEFVYGLYSTNDPNIINDKVESIKFNGNIKEIRDGAFRNFIKLREVSDMDKVEICRYKYLFYGCKSLIKTQKISNIGVHSLDYTFKGCTSLKEVINIPSSVTYMSYTFESCLSLEIIPELPEGIKEMYGILKYCRNLKKAPVIPQKVTNIAYTFCECENLEGELEINIESDSKEVAFSNCLQGASKNSRLTITGKCYFLDKILETKSHNSNIVKK